MNVGLPLVPYKKKCACKRLRVFNNVAGLEPHWEAPAWTSSSPDLCPTFLTRTVTHTAVPQSLSRRCGPEYLGSETVLHRSVDKGCFLSQQLEACESQTVAEGKRCLRVQDTRGPPDTLPHSVADCKAGARNVGDL